MGYGINEDFYLTFVYKINDTESLDRLNYYINGDLYGYTYYGHQGYEEGLSTWNSNDCPLFIGVCPLDITGCLYFMKGRFYALRLYNYSMTETEVADSFDTTQKYRNSF